MSKEKTFEQIKRTAENGTEFWLARELQEVLDYAKWDNFYKVINTAKIACKISQQEVDNHFVEITKTVEIGGRKSKLEIPDLRKVKRVRKIKDYQLTRYACYLIVMNGDPRKEVIALGQTYFAVKTRQQEFNELYDQLNEDERRLFLRGDIRQKNQLLAQAAHKAGIITPHEYATFQDFGYRGLYDGENASDIARRKGVDQTKESILDYMSSLELGANLFRILTTEDVMRKNNVNTKNDAEQTHYKIGKAVRNTIIEVDGTLPEDMPTPTDSIKTIERKQLHDLKKKK